jgi:ABC-type lipoprotein export system ATPase subunit
VEIRRLTHVYDTPDQRRVVAVRNFDLTVGEGEQVGVVGPSGSGKTTLLRVLAGLERATSGRVRVAGQDLGSMSRGRLDAYRRRDVGYLWQRSELGLWQALTVAENVALPLTGSAGSRLQHISAALEVLDWLGLGDMVHRLPADLDDEERQRLALAVALVNRPRLLLADEPSADLDGAVAQRLLKDLRTFLRRYGIAAIVVAHGQEVAPHVDRLVPIQEADPSARAGAPMRRTPDGEDSLRNRPAVLAVDGVSRWITDDGHAAPVVSDVSFRVREGEVVTVLGRSDSGKSALLALCGGLDDPSTGRVRLGGTELTALPEDQRQRTVQEKVAWVLSGIAPPGLMTAQEIVRLSARIGGVSREEAARLALEALAATGLGPRSRTSVALLSGGEQQRVALARALVRGPALIIADEPTAQLDAPAARVVLQLIRDAADSGIAILLASHNPAAAEIADRVLLMENGALREVMRRG